MTENKQAKRCVALGVFKTDRHLEQAIDLLIAIGFRSADVASTGPVTIAWKGSHLNASSLDGLVANLILMGFPTYEAKRCARHVRSGLLLLTVRSEDEEWGESAVATLVECGAIDVVNAIPELEDGYMQAPAA